MFGHDDLVGGDDMLAGADRLLEVRMHGFIAPRHLDQDLDSGVVQELLWIGSQQLRHHRHGPRLLDVAHEHAAQAELDPRPPGQLRLPREQTLGHLASHRAEAYEPNVQ